MTRTLYSFNDSSSSQLLCIYLQKADARSAMLPKMHLGIRTHEKAFVPIKSWCQPGRLAINWDLLNAMAWADFDQYLIVVIIHKIMHLPMRAPSSIHCIDDLFNLLDVADGSAYLLGLPLSGHSCSLVARKVSRHLLSSIWDTYTSKFYTRSICKNRPLVTCYHGKHCRHALTIGLCR